MMTLSQQVLTIAMIVLATMITRFTPFLLFPPHKPTPSYIKHLGKVLPSAVIGLLVIYCFKEVSFLEGKRGLPELLAVAVVTVLHQWKRQMLLSIAGGTMVYMLLVQVLFP